MADRGRSRPPLPEGEPPRWRKAAEPEPVRPKRYNTGERGRSRSAETGRRTEPRSRSGSKSALGQTSGVAAAGAWAARWEIASLLEARCDPSELVSDIRSGREGDHILGVGAVASTATAGSLKSWSPVGSAPEFRKESHGDQTGSGGKLWETDSDDWEQDLLKQHAILESLTGEKAGSLPPWITNDAGSGSAKDTKKVIGPSYVERGARETTFSRAATPPPRGTEIRNQTRAERPQAAAGAEPACMPPPEGIDSRLRESRDRDRDRSRRRMRRRTRELEDMPTSMGQKESAEMEKYFKESLDIFSLLLKKFKVEMELATIIAPEGKVDEARFRLLTRPKKAGTGMNYVRLMTRFLGWRMNRSDLDRREGGFDAKFGVLDFVESLVQDETGYLTPRTFLYAVDYFAIAFGFNAVGGHWHRAKRLASSYAASKTTPPSRAPFFTKLTMSSLEMAVLDPFLSRPERVACGKLRLCVQSSTRFDDILNTPLSGCEWVRRPGERNIIGLRSKALRGKTGGRSWIAALPGVKPDHDKWLIVLMELVLGSHGATWKQDDHFGKMAAGDMVSFIRRPASISADVTLVKSALGKYHREGIDIGMTADELSVLRWHGAKATLSSVMQHLGIGEKTVRFQGSWASRAETMPDTYLREAQTLVLAGQMKCLEYLRSGGEVFRLEGTPVEHPGETDQAAETEAPSTKEDEDVARKAQAMAATKMAEADPGDVAPALLDDGFLGDGSLDPVILEKEKSIFQEGDNWEECLAEPGGDEEDSVIQSPSPLVEEETPEAQDRPADPQDALDEHDTEGLITHWVQAKVMHGNPKVHLPASDTLVEGILVEAKPKCGTSGNFELAKVEDPLDASTQLCRRCVPRSSEGACDGICGHLHLGRKSLMVHRCYRRCHLEGAHQDHKCPLHSKEA